MPRIATQTTVVHEIFGHFYIGTKGFPNRHLDSLTGKGIKGANRQPFQGTVLQFIDTQVIPVARRNFNKP